MSDDNGPAFKRKQVAKIINDVLSRMEKHGAVARNEMAQELEDLKETIQKCCNEIEILNLAAADAENKKKIYWLLGEMEKKLKGPARNFIAPFAPKTTDVINLNASSQTLSEKNGE